MRAYKVSTEHNNDDGGKTPVFRYAGTNAEARQTRDAMVNDYGVKKKEVTIEDVDIPTSKAELLDFINGLLNPTE
jgi:hypothetical protein